MTEYRHDSALAVWLADRGLSIEQRPGRGRCLITLRSRQPGDLLLETPPVAFTALDDVAACDQCGAHKESQAQLKRCTGCSAVRYCDTTCQRKAWTSQHARECSALQCIRETRGVVPPPSLRLAHRVFLGQTASSLVTRAPWASPELLTSLETHRRDVGEEQLLNAAQAAAALLSYAGKTPDSAETWRIDLDPGKVTDIILALSVNAHAVSDAELRPVGRALYPLVACANHDCHPSAVLTFRGTTAQLRATRALDAGTEVCISYIDLTATAAERRAELLEGYHFTCNCERCSTAFSRGGCAHDRLIGGASCTGCGAALPLPLTACMVCGSTEGHPAAETCNALALRVKADIERSKRLRAGGRHASALQLGSNAVDAVSQLSATSAVRTRTIDAALHAAIDAGEWTRALAYAREALPGLIATHEAPTAQGPAGRNVSPVLGLHHAMLGRLLWKDAESPGAVRRAAEALDVAVRMLSVTHGRDHPLVGELDQLCREAGAQAAHQTHAEHLE